MTNLIPDAALDDRLGFVGTSGSGKSYAAMQIVERLLKKKSRVAIIDLLGVFWGLRLQRNGKTKGFDIPIFGGSHGDLPLTELSGALIGETVAGMAESCIVDLSQIGTKAGERRFMLHFLTALYRKANGEPLHIIFDEADMFAPQKLTDKDGEAAKLLGMMETVVRRGRVKGFIPHLLTQRPAVISKDVLSQIDGLIAFKLTSSNDRKAIGAWVEGSADQDQWKAMYDALPGMQTGNGILWIPGRDIFTNVTFPLRETFDSSRTPKRGEKRDRTDLKPLDISGLKDRLAKVDEETKANDPKALRAEIAKLKTEAGKRIVSQYTEISPKPDALRAAETRGYLRGFEKGNAIYAAHVKAAQQFRDTVISAGERMVAATAELADRLDRHKQNISSGAPASPEASPESRRAIPPRTSPRPSSSPGSGDGTLPKGEREIMTLIAQRHDGASRAQITVITGYKRSSRDTYIQRIKQKGYVTDDGSRLLLTDDGRDALGDYEPLPTGDALRGHWLGSLPKGEADILAIVFDAYPQAADKNLISEATGYKRSSRDTYIQRLSARGLVTTSRDGVTASEDLF